ncbi:uncharacterized protein RAG0_06567 [Rhynchosporium agropyri]|uniref:Uncharacterized protein n=1 Tax=Rhynchosporium agropyri TaxID=914238 RepID=A0A1E1KHL0_9HELO|nr:uncharacterized protein RAG0_06567 [Rhynchosporium agropyri]
MLSYNTRVPLLLVSSILLGSVKCQDQQVQWNQVVNLNGNMALTRVILPDRSVVETYSQTQRQLIINQNQSPLSVNHVVGSTGQPFVQLQQNSMTISTNGASDLVGAQIELQMNPNMLSAGKISPENAFVAKLSPDKQTWMVMEGIKSVNTTDSSVRIVKMTNIDGEYMAIGRQTTETSNVLSPFGQQVRVTGSGIQEIEFSDGFRMSLKTSQKMTLNTNVVNGISTTMTSGMSGTPLNNYRYLVTTNLGGIQPNLNSMQAVIQLPRKSTVHLPRKLLIDLVNMDRVMSMATAMGVGADGAVALGVAQRSILMNPGGATNIASNKRQNSNTNSNAKSSTDSNTEGNENSNTNSNANGNIDSNTNSNSNNNINNNPVAAQLLLSPTFAPITARAVIDQANGRVAIPVNNINGEFILTMAVAKSGGASLEAVGSGSQAAGLNRSSTAGEPRGNTAAGISSTENSGSVTMTMKEMRLMMERQANGGVFLAERMFTATPGFSASAGQGPSKGVSIADSSTQLASAPQGPKITTRRNKVTGPTKALPFVG